MNPWASPDRFLVIADAARRRADTDDLVEEMVQALAAAGEYQTQIDLRPTQHVVDFHWAALQAARRVGICVHVTRTISHADSTAEFRVTRQDGPD